VANYGSSSISVIRDSATGIGQGTTHDAKRSMPIPSIVRGVLELPPGRPGQSTTGQSLVFLLDISGRKVMALHAGPNDVSRFAPGVYFVRLEAPGRREMGKVVLTR
jgi:hypothetical protein